MNWQSAFHFRSQNICSRCYHQRKCKKKYAVYSDCGSILKHTTISPQAHTLSYVFFSFLCSYSQMYTCILETYCQSAYTQYISRKETLLKPTTSMREYAIYNPKKTANITTTSHCYGLNVKYLSQDNVFGKLVHCQHCCLGRLWSLTGGGGSQEAELAALQPHPTSC